MTCPRDLDYLYSKKRFFRIEVTASVKASISRSEFTRIT
jgi:hypothetical protein